MSIVGAETEHYVCHGHGLTVIALMEKKRGGKIGWHYYRLPLLKDKRPQKDQLPLF